ncbi:MAG: hypothetical protein HY847_06530 [Betaproteobacteria bacterium]|nr:hypothetical protein [Betaproteobacteria bacterium]
MNQTPDTPWAARFRSLLDKEEIRRQANMAATPLVSLDALPVDAACVILARELKQVFYPTTQVVDILHSLIERALGHCLQHYADARTYMDGIYRKDSPLPEFVPPACLTGLAGVGKSCLASALQRILPTDGTVNCPPESVAFPLRSLWKIDVRIQSSVKEIFTPLGGADGSLSDQVSSARKRAYRDGVSLLLADEFQYLTASAEANTRIAQTLIAMGYCGLPAFYIANYSLLYRLLRRPQEDQDRLLSDVVVMLPDPPESEDWSNTLAAQIGVAPEIFRIDPKTDGPQYHRFCAGIKRAAARLLVIGYRTARTERPKEGRTIVTMRDIKAAYESAAFSAHRSDNEIITQQVILNRQVDRKRRDLWCPIGQPENASAKLANEMTLQREIQLAGKIQQAAATRDERSALADQRASAGDGPSSAVLNFPRKKRRPTADMLKANALSLYEP